MKEYVYTFGENDGLLGIFTEPKPENQTGEPIGVLFLNAGVLHHVGPNRMWVDMARLFSEYGFASFRFDLTGFGDSLNRRSQQSYEERSISDIQEALNLLSRRKGIRKFVLIGFCSGAENAHRAALADNRIIGVVFMDGYAYRTFKFYIKRYGLILLNPLKMIKFLIRNFLSLPTRFSSKSKERDERKKIFASEPLPKHQYIQDIQILINRNVSMLFTFSSGMYRFYNYDGQFPEALGALNDKGFIEHKFYGFADHMYTVLASRGRLMKDILHWLRHKVSANL